VAGSEHAPRLGVHAGGAHYVHHGLAQAVRVLGDQQRDAHLVHGRPVPAAAAAAPVAIPAGAEVVPADMHGPGTDARRVV